MKQGNFRISETSAKRCFQSVCYETITLNCSLKVMWHKQMLQLQGNSKNERGKKLLLGSGFTGQKFLSSFVQFSLFSLFRKHQKGQYTSFQFFGGKVQRTQGKQCGRNCLKVDRTSRLVHIRTLGLCTHVCPLVSVVARLMCNVFTDCSPPYFLKQCLSLIGQTAALRLQAFSMGAGDSQLTSSCLYGQYLIH